MSDGGLIATIGKFIKHERLKQNKTQATVAENAGINRWTLAKIESGKPISLISLIQILRVLNLLHILDSFKIESELSPIELAKLERKKRQRATKAATKIGKTKSGW
ncbi:helix-turn-helix domain-containing protein [Cryomorpha ignava]|nr:helix-turn-helix transcriptional regulator [Cryomorpha ignava]